MSEGLADNPLLDLLGCHGRPRTQYRHGPLSTMVQVMVDVAEERVRQQKLWGDQSHKPYPVWMTILGEEYGESAKEVLEENYQNLYEELIQTAAVAVAFAEALIKNGHTYQ